MFHFSILKAATIYFCLLGTLFLSCCQTTAVTEHPTKKAQQKVHTAIDYTLAAKEAQNSPQGAVLELIKAAKNTDEIFYKQHLTKEFIRIVEQLSSREEFRIVLSWQAFMASLKDAEIVTIEENIFYERASVRLQTKSGKVFHFKLALSQIESPKITLKRQWKITTPKHIQELYEQTFAQ